MMFKISVIIPSYNCQETILKCLGALRSQSVKPHEIIVIDDGSSDASRSIILDFKRDNNMDNLLLVCRKHQERGEARNFGAKKAKEGILVFTDSDCIPPRNWLRSITRPFTDKQVGAVGGGYSGGIDNSFWQRFSTEELIYRRRQRKGNVSTLVSNNLACRKKCFWEAGGFPSEFPVCEDMLLSFRIAQKHKVIWLKNNGVKHHFKRTLADFLKHQYFFGKESTVFFLKNPGLLISGHHQSKVLHLSIVISFLLFVCILAVIFMGGFKWIFLPLMVLLILFHFVLYIPFIVYLSKKQFLIEHLVKAYLISLVRDYVSALSFFHGFLIYTIRNICIMK